MSKRVGPKAWWVSFWFPLSGVSQGLGLYFPASPKKVLRLKHSKGFSCKGIPKQVFSQHLLDSGRTEKYALSAPIGEAKTTDLVW